MREDKIYDAVTISDMEISPKYRGKGYSKILHEHIKKKYAKKNIIARIHPKKSSPLSKKEWMGAHKKRGFKTSKIFDDKDLVYLPQGGRLQKRKVR